MTIDFDAGKLVIAKSTSDPIVVVFSRAHEPTSSPELRVLIKPNMATTIDPHAGHLIVETPCERYAAVDIVRLTTEIGMLIEPGTDAA